MSQTQLAQAAELSNQTIIDFERGARTPHPRNLQTLRSKLEEAGIEFIAENGGGVGVRFRKRRP